MLLQKVHDQWLLYLQDEVVDDWEASSLVVLCN